MRKYDASSRRASAEETRERICAAAEALFLRDGYARTSIKRVAQAAGVAEATVYLAFTNKPALLDAVIVRATRIATPEVVDLASFAAAQAVLMERAAPIIALGEAAALMDAELRPHRERAHASLRAMFARLAPVVGVPAETLYAVCTETTYLRRGLPPGEYAEWLIATLSGGSPSRRS